MSLLISDSFLQTASLSAIALKLEIAILLFEQNRIALGVASSFAELSAQEFQQIIDQRRQTTHAGTWEPNGSKDPLGQAAILQRIEQRRTFAPAQHHLPDTLTLLREDRNR